MLYYRREKTVSRNGTFIKLLNSLQVALDRSLGWMTVYKQRVRPAGGNMNVELVPKRRSRL